MGYDNHFTQQVNLLLEILGVFDWNNCFALKGGTAINFFYESLPRLSVDIDLVYLPINSRTEAFNEMNEILKLNNLKFNKLGFKSNITDISSNNSIGKIVISNKSASIKIEPNIVIRGSLLPAQNRSLDNKIIDLFEQELEVPCLDYKELYAGKLVAMLDRQHPRDIFDMMLFYDKYKSLHDILDFFLVYLIQSNRPIHELLNPNILNISLDYKNSFVGMTNNNIELGVLNKYRELIINELKKGLNKNHKNFLISFMQRNPDWNLLPFKDLDLLPGVQWKQQNISIMSDYKRKNEIQKLEDFLY